MESGSLYSITRHLHGDCKCINVDSKEVYSGDIATLFPILAYSQTEVIKIAESEEAQLNLIDSFIDCQSYLSRIEQIQRNLSTNNKSLSEAILASCNIESLEKDLNTKNNQLAEIEKLLNKDIKGTSILDEYKIMEEKKLFLESQQNYLVMLKEKLNESINEYENLLPPELSESKKMIKILKEYSHCCIIFIKKYWQH